MDLALLAFEDLQSHLNNVVLWRNSLIRGGKLGRWMTLTDSSQLGVTVMNVTRMHTGSTMEAYYMEWIHPIREMLTESDDYQCFYMDLVGWEK